MKILGLTGTSGSGKTTLLTAMIPLLARRGLSVSTVKHAHHGFDLDRPGKDSHRHRAAGAREVLVSGPERWALLHEVTGPEPPLDELIERLAPVDLVLIEGFGSGSHPKIEVFRPGLGRQPLWPGRADIVAVAADVDLYPAPPKLLMLDDPEGVVVWALRFLESVAALPRAP